MFNQTAATPLIEEKIPLKQGLKLNSLMACVVAMLIEEKIPLKQGLKRIGKGSFRWSTTIEEKIPLKQGLKLSTTLNIKYYGNNWREDSIKTRIETFNSARRPG